MHETANPDQGPRSPVPEPASRKTRIVILGGGFGGAYTARHLEELFRRRPDVGTSGGVWGLERG